MGEAKSLDIFFWGNNAGGSPTAMGICKELQRVKWTILNQRGQRLDVSMALEDQPLKSLIRNISLDENNII